MSGNEALREGSRRRPRMCYPSLLTPTGYEQVRSIVSALTGDWEAARNVELVLPETGVCSTDGGGSCAVPSTQRVAGQVDGVLALAS